MAVAEHMVRTPDNARTAASRPQFTTQSGWRLAVLAGIVFAVVGWIDVVLLWVPMRIGAAQWEFATTSGTFDALPLGTIGILILSLRLIADGGRGGRLATGAVAATIALLLAGVFVVFMLSFVTGYGATEGDTRIILLRAGIKTSLYAVAYVVLYSAVALSLFRSTRKAR